MISMKEINIFTAVRKDTCEYNTFLHGVYIPKIYIYIQDTSRTFRFPV
jgi:hypothetical protein